MSAKILITFFRTSLQSKQKFKISLIIIPLITNFALCVLIDFLSLFLSPSASRKSYCHWLQQNYLVSTEENMIMNFYLTFSDVKENQQKSSKNRFSHDLVYRVIWILFFDIYFVSLEERLWVIKILTSQPFRHSVSNTDRRSFHRLLLKYLFETQINNIQNGNQWILIRKCNHVKIRMSGSFLCTFFLVWLYLVLNLLFFSLRNYTLYE